MSRVAMKRGWWRFWAWVADRLMLPSLEARALAHLHGCYIVFLDEMDLPTPRWLLTEYHYWLPRAKKRLQALMPYGREYPIDPRWPDLAFDADDTRSLKKTERQLDRLTLATNWEFWVIAKVRLEDHCEVIYGRTGRDGG